MTKIDVPHFPLATTLDEVWQYIQAIIDQKHDYKTFVIDTIDWMEKLIWAETCKEANLQGGTEKKSIEDFGYAKGYIFALKHWDRLFCSLDKIRNKGIAVLVLAHNEIKTFSPPDGEAYDRYQIKLHRHAATRLSEWADVVLFANFVVYTYKDGLKQKATGSSERIIHTTNSPAWQAKTRYILPEQLPMDFSKLMEEIKK